MRHTIQVSSAWTVLQSRAHRLCNHHSYLLTQHSRRWTAEKAKLSDLDSESLSRLLDQKLPSSSKRALEMREKQPMHSPNASTSDGKARPSPYDASKFPPNSSKRPRMRLTEDINQDELVYEPRYSDMKQLFSEDSLRRMPVDKHGLIQIPRRMEDSRSEKKEASEPSNERFASVLFSYGKGVSSDTRITRWIQIGVISMVALTTVRGVAGPRDFSNIRDDLMTQYGANVAWYTADMIENGVAIVCLSLIPIAVRLWRSLQKTSDIGIVDTISVVRGEDMARDVLRQRKIEERSSEAMKLREEMPEMLLRLDLRRNLIQRKVDSVKFLPLNLNSPRDNHYLQLVPHKNEDSGQEEVKCVIQLTSALPRGDQTMNDDDKQKNEEEITVELPMDGSVHNWEAFLLLLAPIPNAAGKFTPVKVQRGGFIPVATVRELMSVERSTLEIFTHGVPPYRRRFSFLFVPNSQKSALYVLLDHCVSANQSLVHGAQYYEEGSRSFLHCGKCFNKKLGGECAALKSTVDWLLESDFVDDRGQLRSSHELNQMNRASKNEGRGLDCEIDPRSRNLKCLNLDEMVYVRLNLVNVCNHRPHTDAYGSTALETLVNFHCANSFRLSMPQRPSSMEDVWIVGKLNRYEPWKDGSHTMKLHRSEDLPKQTKVTDT